MKTLLLLLFSLLAVAALAPEALAQDPLTKAALERIAEVEKAEPGVKEGDVSAANRQLNRLAWAGKRLMAVNDKTEANWKEAEKRYRALWEKLEKKAGATPPPSQGYDHAKLVALNKDVGNSFENLKMLRIKDLADDARARGFKKDIEKFRERIAAFPAEDDNVKLVTANIDDLEKLLNVGLDQIASDRAAAAELNGKLTALSSKYDLQQFPARIEAPFSEEQIRSWAAQLVGWERVDIPRDLEWLASVSGNTAIDGQKVNSLRSYLTTTWKWKIEEAEKGVRERIASDVWQGQDVATFVLETDASDRNHVLQRILGRGAFDENMAALRKGLHAVEMARVFQDATGRPAIPGPEWSRLDPSAPVESPDRDAQQKQVVAAIEHLEKLARVALDAVRMPKAASTDEELLKIARETLALEKYEIAGWEGLVINADKRRVTRKEAWLRPGAVYSTISFYDYTWDQFQVTTAEKVGDEVWLFSNLLKYYHSGDPTSPVGRWVLSKRFELTPILAENVHE